MCTFFFFLCTHVPRNGQNRFDEIQGLALFFLFVPHLKTSPPTTSPLEGQWDGRVYRLIRLVRCSKSTYVGVRRKPSISQERFKCLFFGQIAITSKTTVSFEFTRVHDVTRNGLLSRLTKSWRRKKKHICKVRPKRVSPPALALVAALQRNCAIRQREKPPHLSIYRTHALHLNNASANPAHYPNLSQLRPHPPSAPPAVLPDPSCLSNSTPTPTCSPRIINLPLHPNLPPTKRPHHIHPELHHRHPHHRHSLFLRRFPLRPALTQPTSSPAAPPWPTSPPPTPSSARHEPTPTVATKPPLRPPTLQQPRLATSVAWYATPLSSRALTMPRQAAGY